MPRKKSAAPAANIRFISRNSGRYFPLVKFSDGSDSFLIEATPEQQRKGFYHADAARIVRLFPQLYKLITRKGAR